MMPLFHRFICLNCASIIMHPPSPTGAVYIMSQTHICSRGGGGQDLRPSKVGAYDLTSLEIPVEVAHATFSVGGREALLALVQERVSAWTRKAPV